MFLISNLDDNQKLYCRTILLEVSNYRGFVGYLMEVLYIYNPQNETMSDHQEEVMELFHTLTVEIPGITTGRVITLEAFNSAIDLMMSKAYHSGQMEGMYEAEDIVDQVFSRKK